MAATAQIWIHLESISSSKVGSLQSGTNFDNSLTSGRFSKSSTHPLPEVEYDWVMGSEAGVADWTRMIVFNSDDFSVNPAADT